MKKIFSIFIIVLLLLTTTVIPVSFNCSSYFVYASEELSNAQKVQAGISVYLNSRGGYLIGDVDSVESLMNQYINSVEFWQNTTVGSIADVYASIIIKYNPFRVELKGSAVRAFNDLYDYLKNKGLVSNAEDSDGGHTSDTLYEGYISGSTLFYIINSSGTATGRWLNPSDIVHGNIVDGITGSYLANLYMSNETNSSKFDFTSSSGSGQSSLVNVPVTITYASDCIRNISIKGYKVGYGLSLGDNFKPYIGPVVESGMSGGPFYCERVNHVNGNACWYMIQNNPNTYYPGYVSYDQTNDKYWFMQLGSSWTNVTKPGVLPTTVDFDTDSFDKNSLSVPVDGQSSEFTPYNKDSGDTYNTYNDYIYDYSHGDTTIINDIIEDDNGSSDNPVSGGTITPDGNGGFTFQLPDFQLPDLSGLNWSLSGLTEKFPFSIPFDLLAFFTVLNAEPETPELQGTINLGLVDWSIDWDLHNFDNIASLLRNLEFIGFCIALILITRRLIKG